MCQSQYWIMQVSVWRELCSTVRYSVAEVCCLGSVCVVCELYVAVVCSVEEVASLVCPVVSCVFVSNEETSGWLYLLFQAALNLEKLFNQGELSEVSKPWRCSLL